MVWTTIRLYLPIQEDEIETLQTGDRLLLNGQMFSMRDKALERLQSFIENKKAAPINFKNSLIFYSGPTPSPEGEFLQSKEKKNIQKLDPIIIRLTKKFDIRGIIGNGPRSDIFRDYCKTNKTLYLEPLVETGNHLTHYLVSKKIAAFEDLGSEAIYQLEIKNLPLVIINDIYGRDLYEIAKNDDSKATKEIMKSLSNKSSNIT